MLKRIISIMLLLCMLLSAAVRAETPNAVKEEAPEVSSELTQENRQNIGVPPAGGMRPGDVPPQMPEGAMPPENMGRVPGNMQNLNESTQTEQETGFLGFIKTNSTPVTSVILLGLAFIFVIFYRRKNY